MSEDNLLEGEPTPDAIALTKLYEMEGWKLVLFHLRSIREEALVELGQGLRPEFNAGRISGVEGLKQALHQIANMVQDNQDYEIDSADRQRAEIERYATRY